MFLSTIALATVLAADSCCGMAAFTSDPNFRNIHPEPIPFAFVAESGQMVSFKDADGKSAQAFYVPPKSGVKSAVVLIHEWWGLNDYIKQLAEKLNDQTGFGILALDMYDGKVASNREDAAKYMQAVQQDRARAVVGGAVMALDKGSLGTKFDKIGTLGFCFGGGWSLQTAIEGGKNVDACVLYYGMPETDLNRLRMIQAPVLMIHAEQDQWITKDVVNAFAENMKKLGKSLRVEGYDAAHGFANPSNPRHDETVTEDAANKTLAFLKTHL